jgi:hypothetical protein
LIWTVSVLQAAAALLELQFREESLRVYRSQAMGWIAFIIAAICLLHMSVDTQHTQDAVPIHALVLSRRPHNTDLQL